MTTAGTGSGAGIEDASDGKADIGASDAYLSSGDLVTNPRLLNIPLAVSAQTVIYNVPGLPAGSHLQLTGTVLAEIYSGTITSWNDPQIKALNPNLPLPPLTIVPLHRSDRSGDTFLFTSYLSTQDPAWDQSIGYGTTANWPKVAAALPEDGSLAVAARLRGDTPAASPTTGSATWPRRRRPGSARRRSPTRPRTSPCRPPARSTPRWAASCRSPRPTRRSR